MATLGVITHNSVRPFRVVQRGTTNTVNRLRRDIAEHWRHQQGYRVEIRGVPDYDYI
jgi:hypothetical protein